MWLRGETSPSYLRWLWSRLNAQILVWSIIFFELSERLYNDEIFFQFNLQNQKEILQ